MPKFLTIGYGDREGYESTPKSLRDEAHAQDARLAKAGALMGVAGKPVQVRNHQAGGLRTQSGAYMRAQLPVAGFAVIEAATLDEAIQMVSRVPCAVANGVVEVWPIQESPGRAAR